jgi:hypothetical protein
MTIIREIFLFFAKIFQKKQEEKIMFNSHKRKEGYEKTHELYRLMVSSIESTRRIIYTINLSQEETDAILKAKREIQEFTDFLDINKSILEKDFVPLFEQIPGSLNKFINSINTFYHAGSEKWGDKVEQTYLVHALVFDSEIPGIRGKIEALIRKKY